MKNFMLIFKCIKIIQSISDAPKLRTLLKYIEAKHMKLHTMVNVLTIKYTGPIMKLYTVKLHENSLPMHATIFAISNV